MFAGFGGSPSANNREALIAQKQQVRAQLEQIQRQLAQARTEAARRKVAQLETELERLQAQEYQLRVAIDQSR